MSWSAKPARTPLVLVVDDEDVVRNYLQRLLEGAGYRVVTARNSVEAFQKAAEIRETIDLLITEYDLRIYQNGAVLASFFRILRPETRILITSASALPEGAIPSGSNWEFFSKPFSNGDLLHRVRAMAGVPRKNHNWDVPCLV